MKKILFFALILLTLIHQESYSQQVKRDSTVSFSLKAAQDFALKNSPVVKNAKLDVESAKKLIWQSTAIGLPQVNSKLAFSYQITLPAMETEFTELTGLFGWMYGVDQYLAHSSGGIWTPKIPNPGESQAVTTNELKWGLTYDVTVSELLFNATYIVGLQTVKIYKEFTDVTSYKSQYDVNELVTNAYYLVLIAQENKNILDTTYANTQKILDYITAYNNEGQNENTDVDQMTLTLTNINNALFTMKNQVEVAKNLLKYQMGVDFNKNIVLTDNLETLLASDNLASLMIQDFKVENNTDYKLSDINVNLQKANVRLNESPLLPDISAYYNHDWNFNKNSFTFTPPDIVGVSMNIPIFGSGYKLAKLSQAKIALDKAKILKDQVTSGLQTSFTNNKSSYMTAFNNYAAKKKNVALAEKIYYKSITKYKEGTIGSLELTTAQNQYLQAQSDYYTAIIDLSAAKSKLEKMFK